MKKTEKFVEVKKAYEALSDQSQDNSEGLKKQQFKDSSFFETFDRSFFEDFESSCNNLCNLMRTGLFFSQVDAGNFERCKSLIQEGVDVNIKHNGSNHYINNLYLNLTPIEIAIQKDHDTLFSYLVKNGARISPNIAIKFDSNKVFNFLLKQDSDLNINYQDEEGNTALHHVFTGYLNKNFDYSNGNLYLKYDGFIELLLSKKDVQFDIKNNNGISPFNLFIDNVQRNKNNINTDNGAVDKENIPLYQIYIKHRERLDLISRLFVKNKSSELKYRDNTLALDMLNNIDAGEKYNSNNIIQNIVYNNNALVSNPQKKNRMSKKDIYCGIDTTLALLVLSGIVLTVFTDYSAIFSTITLYSVIVGIAICCVIPNSKVEEINISVPQSTKCLC